MGSLPFHLECLLLTKWIEFKTSRVVWDYTRLLVKSQLNRSTLLVMGYQLVTLRDVHLEISEATILLISREQQWIKYASD